MLMDLCRGQGARQADVSMFSHPGLYTPWAVQPLTVASAADRFAKCEMSASLLSNDQASINLNKHRKQFFASCKPLLILTS